MILIPNIRLQLLVNYLNLKYINKNRLFKSSVLKMTFLINLTYSVVANYVLNSNTNKNTSWKRRLYYISYTLWLHHTLTPIIQTSSIPFRFAIRGLWCLKRSCSFVKYGLQLRRHHLLVLNYLSNSQNVVPTLFFAHPSFYPV